MTPLSYHSLKISSYNCVLKKVHSVIPGLVSKLDLRRDLLLKPEIQHSKPHVVDLYQHPLLLPGKV